MNRTVAGKQQSRYGNECKNSDCGNNNAAVLFKNNLHTRSSFLRNGNSYPSAYFTLIHALVIGERYSQLTKNSRQFHVWNTASKILMQNLKDL